MTIAGNMETTKTTSWKVVLPFYGYASLAFLVSTVLLLISPGDLLMHYFSPHILAITHIMALGWGTMMILGASHQLVPVLVESKLYSNKLAWISFILAATGIPLLAYGFYVFDMGSPSKWGGRFILLSIIAYLINLGISMQKSKQENVHAVFIFTSVLWLLATATIGLMLVYNFTFPFMPKSSLEYLPLHAHLGVIGWFLLMVTGVGSRLIPMFLISKYSNTRQLWWIYGLLNGALLTFFFIFLMSNNRFILLFPLVAVGIAIVLFGNFCYKSYNQRIRKKLDEQMKMSLLSVLMMILPIIFLAVIVVLLVILPGQDIRLITTYGFIIFFGWITAIILGMTFKTLPFIVWNKVYHQLAGTRKTPNPKDLFNNTIFKWMSLAYIFGFLLFAVGILIAGMLLLKVAALLLFITSILYNWNVMKLLLHKPSLT